MSQSPEVMAMARAVYASYGAESAKAEGAAVDARWVAAVLAGEADDTHGVKIAALAIVQTTEAAAKLADVNFKAAGRSIKGQDILNRGRNDFARQMKTALRTFSHLTKKGADDGL